MWTFFSKYFKDVDVFAKVFTWNESWLWLDITEGIPCWTPYKAHTLYLRMKQEEIISFI